MSKGRLLAVSLAALTASACASVGERPTARGSYAPVTDPAPIVSGTMRPYQIRGRWYRPEEQPGYDEVGLASWYGDAFHGRPTASGERFDMHELTAAHKTLPLPGLVEVTNLATGQRAVLRVNDRGPFVDGRIIDLSRGAAESLGLLSQGVGRVRVRYLGRAPRLGGGQPLQRAEAASTPAPSVNYWVSAGAFLDRDNADRLARDFTGAARVARDGELFRLTLGPYADANTAERARQAAVARGVPDARLFTAP